MTHIKDRIAAALLLIVAIGVFVASGGLPFKSMIFPRMITAVMALCAVLMFLRTVSLTGGAAAADGDPKRDDPFFRNPTNFVITVVAMFAYLFLIQTLGYFTATVILIVGLSLALGFRNLPLLGASTIGFVVFVYVVFVLIFERPLPKGLFI